MRWGVTYSALLFNMVFTMEAFLLTQESADACCCVRRFTASARCCAPAMRDSSILCCLWARTRLPALFANLRVWKASSYCPLVIDLPNRRGRRAGDLLR